MSENPTTTEPGPVGKVIAGATTSIDGYIAGPDDSGFDLLFQWYGSGDVEIPVENRTARPMRVSEASAEVIKKILDDTGALVVGRHLYDLDDAWGGRHPMDVTTVVLTHRPPDDRPLEDENFVFVTEGIEAAVAKAQQIAGPKDVAVNGGQMARQCLDAGLLDEIRIELVPVVLGAGTHLFEGINMPVQFEGPISVIEGTGVTHLRYRVMKTP